MAEVTGFRNNALPYPVSGLPWGVVFPILDADGDLVSGAAGLDSEVSKNGDTFADCTNEATEIGSSGMYYLLLTGSEMIADVVTVVVKTSTTDAKTTPMVFYTRKVATIHYGTAAGGASGYVTLNSSASAIDNFYAGMVIWVDIDGTPEVRHIYGYTGSTKQAAVYPNWNVVPDSNDGFYLYLPDGMISPDIEADALLARNVAGGSSSGRTVKQAFYALRNRWETPLGVYTVYETDDTTISWTSALSSDPAAEPLIGSNPT